MKKVLVVCLGNICRSPMAEGLFKKAAEEKQLPLMIDSAATSQWEVGNSPHPGTVQVLNRVGVNSKDMIARQITQDDFYHFDWIIAMDQQNLTDLQQMAPKEMQEKLFLYMSVVEGKKTLSIPDPYYTGDFEQTYQMLNEGIDAWFEKFASDPDTPK